jgi:hypothetical protein
MRFLEAVHGVQYAADPAKYEQVPAEIDRP